jgi:16S rRNA (guanine527-N7)-methyltransferase
MNWNSLFPEALDAQTCAKLDALASLLREWNAKLNLVSRKDIDALEAHHMAPCVLARRLLPFGAGDSVLDVGTGGGLPGLVLATLFPQTQFLLVDSIGKKIRAVGEMARALNLENVQARQARAESLPERFDFATGRAVTALPVFISWIQNKFKSKAARAPQSGLYYWKGGELEAALAAGGLKPAARYDLADYLPQKEYFAGKYIVHFRAADLERFRPPRGA